jgi:ActR/RegA family two-component response regulator
MSQEKKKILILDDDERWLQRIEAILQSDYAVTVSSTEEEALALLREHPFSLVVLDMKLANGVSGLDVFARMQRVATDLPAIMLTGYPERSSMRDSFKKGFFDYLEKASPNLDDELKTVVADMIAKGGELNIANLIAGGENKELEFKTSARWDSRANKVNKDLEKIVIKTIAGFLNSETGGKLLLGVDDAGNVVGIEDDYKTLVRKDRDGYEGYLTNLLLDAFGKDLSLWLRVAFHELQQRIICEVTARPSPKPVFVTDDKSEHLYVRTGNSTRLLSTREAIEYCKVRWKE